MSNSYKFYSDTKDIMKKYVNATEGAIIYGISKSRIMVLASEAGAVYKVGNSAFFFTSISVLRVLLMWQFPVWHRLHLADSIPLTGWVYLQTDLSY